MVVRASEEDKSSPSPPPSESPKNPPPPLKDSQPAPSSSPPASKEDNSSTSPSEGNNNTINSAPPKVNDSPPPSPPPPTPSPPPPQENISPPTSNNSPTPENKNSSPLVDENNTPPQKENGSPLPPKESNDTSPLDENNAPPSPPENCNSPLVPSPSSAENTSKLPPSPLALSPPFNTPSQNSYAPPKELSPPKASSTDDVTPVSESSHNGTKVAAIASVVVASGLLILVFAVFVVVCTRKKNKKHGKHMYYENPPRGGGYYPNNKPNWQNANMSQDYSINLPLPPGGPNGFQPSPLPPLMGSGEMSTSYASSHSSAMTPLHSNSTLGVNQSQFSYEELAAATSGFSQANLLGQGGFGYVHKGVLPNGKEVAVKSLKSGSGQGDREFRAEVEIINRVHHRHLVSLVGFCILNEQKMLVYEFVPNNTLEYHLHGQGHPTLSWPSRLKIALGSAKGLAYLHEDCHPRIIHRDIKASNILIDEAFEAKVADFGLAKLTADNFTHVSTRVMGTFGYLAPEYASSGKLTEKSDVFSFGVMLLELITGRRPVDHSGNMEDSLVDWARPLCQRALEEGNYGTLVDPSLEGNYVPQEMVCMVACAAASIRHSGRRRPKMSQIVRALEGDVSLEDLNEGTKPGQSGIHGSYGNSDYDASTYSEDMKKFRKLALESQQYGSSDYGVTSEYGLNPSTSSSDSEVAKNNSQML